MMLQWPWAKLEWRAVCAERCKYGSGRRSASALLTPLATWQGFVYVAFVIDVFARRIVGWRASRTAHASFVLDALEQALHDRRPAHGGGLVHHSDRGVQYVSIRYSERLAEAGIEPSVGSVGDSYDNALAETINGLYKAEVIHRRGPWRSFEAVEFATLGKHPNSHAVSARADENQPVYGGEVRFGVGGAWRSGPSGFSA